VNKSLTNVLIKSLHWRAREKHREEEEEEEEEEKKLKSNSFSKKRNNGRDGRAPADKRENSQQLRREGILFDFLLCLHLGDVGI